MTDKLFGILGLFRGRVQWKRLQDYLRHGAEVHGHLLVETREGGRLRQRAKGHNIWTLTGREFLAESSGLASWTPRTRFRDDVVAYIGVGSGAQAEVSEISSLVDPVVYKSGEFLAATDAPAEFPSSGTLTTNTSIRFVREFSEGEISLGYNVVLTEAGLFTDGDPNNDWDVESTPTDFSTAASRAPVAYKVFEPATKTTQFTARFVWDVRFV